MWTFWQRFNDLTKSSRKLLNAFQFHENVLNCLEAEKIQGAYDFRNFGEIE